MPRDDTLEHPRTVFQILKRHYALLHPGDGAATSAVSASRISAISSASISPRTAGASARPPSPTRWGGRNIARACSSFAPQRCYSCCSAISGAPAAASWRCAATPTFKARPTSQRFTTYCRAICQCPRRARTTTFADYLDAGGVEEAERLLGRQRRQLTSSACSRRGWGDAARQDNSTGPTTICRG